MKRVLLFVASAFLAATTPLHAQASSGQESPRGGEASLLFHRPAPKVPAYVVFAGDTVRLNNALRRERMDRELLAFTHMHSTSTLMLKRSKRIFAIVEPILRQEGVPDDLKYLMVIESNLDPKAVSVSGAAGLWQFMKAVAPHYGLEVSAEVDERFHIEKSTHAACKLLKEAHRRYRDKDWMTTAASYNAGQGAITRRRKEQRRDSSLDLWLNEETSRYMYRILTAKFFFEHPQQFGFYVPDEERYPYVAPRKIVTVSEKIPSLTEFAFKHKTTYLMLKESNLWLRDTLLTNKAARTYRILIPRD